MMEIKAVIQPFMLEHVLEALHSEDALPGLTISDVKVWGRSTEAEGHRFATMVKVEVVVEDEWADRVGRIIADAARTGRSSDGKIFLSAVSVVLSVQTGQKHH